MINRPTEATFTYGEVNLAASHHVVQEGVLSHQLHGQNKDASGDFIHQAANGAAAAAIFYDITGKKLTENSGLIQDYLKLAANKVTSFKIL